MKVGAYNLYNNSEYNNTSVDMSQVINPNDNEWFNYLLEEIRAKTDAGKTKKAAHAGAVAGAPSRAVDGTHGWKAYLGLPRRPPSA